jgi:uncharacterized protein YqhQ
MKKTSIGGQAVIEGVMMRGPEKIAVAVRKIDKEIVVDKRDYIGLSKRSKFFNLPIIRGVIAFFESLVIGTKTLMTSAEYFDIEDEDAEESKIDKFFEKLFGDKLQEVVITISVIIAVVFGVGLFILLPNYIAGFLEKLIESTILLNVVEGVLRLLIFFIYIISVSKMKDIQRVFEYHGAEHKSIYCYENGDELTIENVKKYSRLHPRCGTSFLLIVMVISILVFSFAGWGGIAVRILSRLLLLPIVAGLSYEIIKWAGRSDSKFACAVSKPGMWFQLITTREPNDEQIEVAISALKAVLIEDREADLW